MTLELDRNSPGHLSFLAYVRALGKVHGEAYAVMGKDGVMEWKSQAWLLYTDDVCLMASSE